MPLTFASSSKVKISPRNKNNEVHVLPFYLEKNPMIENSKGSKHKRTDHNPFGFHETCDLVILGLFASNCWKLTSDIPHVRHMVLCFPRTVAFAVVGHQVAQFGYTSPKLKFTLAIGFIVLFHFVCSLFQLALNCPYSKNICLQYKRIMKNIARVTM